MSDRNQESELARKAAQLMLAWVDWRKDNVLDPDEDAEIAGLISDVHVLAELRDAAGHFERQLARIPYSAPNRTVRDQLADLQRIVAEWEQAKTAFPVEGKAA